MEDLAERIELAIWVTSNWNKRETLKAVRDG